MAAFRAAMVRWISSFAEVSQRDGSSTAELVELPDPVQERASMGSRPRHRLVDAVPVQSGSGGERRVTRSWTPDGQVQDRWLYVRLVLAAPRRGV
jgi:hypothetical protein